MKTAPVGIHAPLKREIRAVVPAENLLRLIFKQLNAGAHGWLKRFTLHCFKSIGRIGDGLHAGYGAAPPARCQ
ncbi:MAG: hypothetical protein NTNFB01_37750 [Nitrospira sp.]